MSLELIDHILGEEFHILRMDESISEIMVNENGTVWTERAGFLEQQPISFTQQQLITTIQAIAKFIDDDFNEKKPILDARLEDGSRVAALHSCCTLGSHTLTIRKFQTARWTLEGLIAAGALTAPMVETVRKAITRSEERRVGKECW